jgi:protein-S-isoprenylcysteine O-methyltransferase Ste14
MQWKWSNVPLPEAHLAGLIAGILLNALCPRRISRRRLARGALGSLSMLGGAGLAAWSVLEASDISIGSPDRLLTTGPYAITRNPMYLAWSAITLGVAFLLNTVWLLLLMPLVLLYVHLVDVKREEKELAARFHQEYAAYRAKVPRYL